MRERTPLLVLLLALSLPAQVLPTAHARLEGQVLDPRGRPVPGALVQAEVDGEVRARTHSDAQGTFVFGRLPQQVVVVRATTKAPDVGGNWVDLVGLERGFVRIVTLPARKIFGTVRDDQDTPVAGAWVLAAPNDAIDFAHASCEAQSDANGRYELTHVPFGPVLVRAWAAEHDAFEGAADDTADVALDARVERDGVQRHTFDLLDASAEQTATALLVVTATHRNLPVPLPPPLRRMRPDAAGRWTVAGWPYADTVHASARLADAAVTPTRRTMFAGRGGSHGRFAVGDAAACIRGQLVGPEGLPLAGLHLLAQPLQGDDASLWRAFGRTDAAGRFTIASPVDRGERFALRLVDGNAAVDRLQPARALFLAEHGSEQHDVPIQPERRIRLRVLAEDRAPVHGAAVTVFAALARAVQVHGLATPTHAQGQAIASGTSDLDGRVDIAGLWLQPGERLTAFVSSPLGWQERFFEVAEARPADLGDIVLQPAATLAGRCVDGDGRPYAGARFELASNRLLLHTRITAATDREGRFAVAGLLPGDYMIRRRDESLSWQVLSLDDGVTEFELR